LRNDTSLVATCLLATPALLWASAAAAEDSIIQRPGDHPNYVVELEPEAIVLFGRAIGDGPGAGVRATIPFMHNGFVPTINNVPGLSLGLSRSPLGDSKAPFYAPAVFHWSFWLSTHFSVLGEAGVFVVFGDGADTHLEAALMAGGRFHITPRIAITARVSLPVTPSIGVGVSFFL